MSLATAIKETMLARGLTTAQLAARMGRELDHATFYRLLNGRTTSPRVATLVQLCSALETSPSDLLDLAGVWSPDTPGQATPADLRLRGAFRQVRALPVATQRRVAPLVAALAAAWVPDAGEQLAGEDEDLAGGPRPPARRRLRSGVTPCG